PALVALHGGRCCLAPCGGRSGWGVEELWPDSAPFADPNPRFLPSRSPSPSLPSPASGGGWGGGGFGHSAKRPTSATADFGGGRGVVSLFSPPRAGGPDRRLDRNCNAAVHGYRQGWRAADRAYRQDARRSANRERVPCRHDSSSAAAVGAPQVPHRR